MLASNVAFFLIFPLLSISRRGVAIVLLFIVLFIMVSFVPLDQLLLQLLIAFGEPLNHGGEGLHLSFQDVGWVPGLLVDGSH